MAQTCVLIDYDLETWEIRRIIHPEDDSQIDQHKEQPGWGRVRAPHHGFPITADGRPEYSLDRCEDEIERVTGRRPPKR
jgi:hypothetical protein